MLLDRKIWAIASGKGGVGKSTLAASMAAHLAELGFPVLLVDVDLTCANLHTLLGVEWPSPGLWDFIEREVEHIEEVAVQTSIKNLRLVAGVMDPMLSSKIRFQQKRRIIRQLNTQSDDVVILDIGTGANLTQVELFRAADLGAIMVTPEPTSVENAYRFMRMIYFHRVREIQGWKKFERSVPEHLMDGATPPVKFLAEIDKIEPKWAAQIRKRMENYIPGIVINKAINKEDKDLGWDMSLVCKRYFGIEAPFLGAIEFDECVTQAARRGRPVISEYTHSRPSRSIRQITETMLSLSRRRV